MPKERTKDPDQPSISTLTTLTKNRDMWTVSTQANQSCVASRRVMALTAAMTQTLEDTWRGVLDTGAVRVPINVQLHRTEDDWKAVIVTRAGVAIEVDARISAESEVAFSAPKVDLKFNLQLTPTGELAGECRHMDAHFPVVLDRASGPKEKVRHPRPQTPTFTASRIDEEVAFEGPAGRLAGVLSQPSRRQDSAPVMVLATWMGPADRDQEIAGHKPFALWASRLADAGVTTLRYDKRGVGASDGDYATASTADFASDLAAAVRYLRRRPELMGRQLGLLGHSEGGHIAADVAASDPTINFCVLLTPSGVAGDEGLSQNAQRVAEAVGARVATPPTMRELSAKLVQAARTAANSIEAIDRSRTILQEAVRNGEFPAARVESRARMLASPWHRYWLNYDPVRSLRQLDRPVLIVLAEKDLQAPPTLHGPPVRAAIDGHRSAEIHELPGLNHLLQPAVTGAPSEYALIETTLSESAINLVVEWVQRQARRVA